MSLSEAEMQGALDAMARAPFEEDAWEDVLGHLARAANGWAAQLIGVAGQQLQFNIATGLPDELNREFEARGGANPRINFRMRVWHKPAYQISQDLDYGTKEEFGQSEFFNDFIYRNNCADLAGVRLPDAGGTQICLAVLKDARRKILSEEDRRDLGALLRPLNAALQLRAKFENGAAQVIAKTFAAFDQAIFVVDANDRVLSLTPTAEKLLKERELLQVRNRKLSVPDAALGAKLNIALQFARSHSPMPSGKVTVVLLRDEDGACIAHVAPIPSSRWSTRFGPVAMVLVNVPQDRQREILEQAFGLSPAEACVAYALRRGSPLEEIAYARNVSISTIRSQLKNIYSKVGATRQCELVAVISDLLG